MDGLDLRREHHLHNIRVRRPFVRQDDSSYCSLPCLCASVCVFRLVTRLVSIFCSNHISGSVPRPWASRRSFQKWSWNFPKWCARRSHNRLIIVSVVRAFFCPLRPQGPEWWAESLRCHGNFEAQGIEKCDTAILLLAQEVRKLDLDFCESMETAARPVS